MLDTKIVNGVIVDGTGRDRFRSDIGIKKDKINSIGDLSEIEADTIIDAENNIVSPGFIDVHSHSDLMLIKNPLADKKIKQGVTTELVGNCGLSLAPKKDEYEEKLKDYVGPLLGGRDGDWKWETLGEYFSLIESRGINLNMAAYVAHGTLRLAVMGFEKRKPTSQELEEMKSILAKSMQDGALGLTTGLIYSPGSHATNEEIKELCSVVAEYGGIYTSHVRNEADNILHSYRETIDIAREFNMPVNISHHKVTDPDFWGKSVETLWLITQARVEGLEITCDQYPYKAGSTTATVLCPPWTLENGVEGMLDVLKNSDKRDKIKEDFKTGLPDWQCLIKEVGWRNIIIAGVQSDENNNLEGKSFAQAAIDADKNPADFLFDLLLEEEGQVVMIVHQQEEEDLRRIMRYPYTMVGTDGVFAGKPHPRLTNTFPRVLGRYVREYGVLRLEEAVRKMTSLPARVFSLNEIGKIEKGYNADIVIFDKEKIIDRGTYEDPLKSPEGMEMVIVNGQIAMKKGNIKKTLSGKVFRNN